MVLARVSLVYLLVGCHGSAPPQHAAPETTAHTAFGEVDEAAPAYDQAELARVLAAERDAVAAAEARRDDLDEPALADLAVRRRFVAALEACSEQHVRCPPRLDDPPWSDDPDAPKLDAHLRFDLDDWRKLALELHGRACACRTLACVDSLGFTIDALEKRPMPDVEADEVASASITHARECLFRLRGRTR